MWIMSEGAISGPLTASEGCVLKAYPDPATKGDPWTIGIGHTAAAGSPKVYRGMVITKAQAIAICKSDLLGFERGLDPLFSKAKRIVKQREADAIIMWTFNVGLGNAKSSTLMRKYVAGAPAAEVAAEFLKWTKAAGRVMPGLVTRRHREANWFIYGSVPQTTTLMALAAEGPQEVSRVIDHADNAAARLYNAAALATRSIIA